MSYEQFWEYSPDLAKAYRTADEIRKGRTNEQLWLAGMYTAEALASTVGNLFSKSKNKYPSEPFPITAAEQQARQERERMAKAERIKNAFMSKALSTNAKMGAIEK